MARTIVPCTPIERTEDDAQRDMAERGRRLAEFKAKTEGRIWQRQENGEWWLVTVHTNIPMSTPSDER